MIENGEDKFPTPMILLWSAADEDGIRRITELYGKYFQDLLLPDSPKGKRRYLCDLAYTISERRSDLPWKSFSIVSDCRQLGESILSELSAPVRSSTAPSISYVFTGQGAQWHGMARGLSAYPVFLESLHASRNHLERLGCPWDPIGSIFRY